MQLLIKLHVVYTTIDKGKLSINTFDSLRSVNQLVLFYKF